MRLCRCLSINVISLFVCDIRDALNWGEDEEEAEEKVKDDKEDVTADSDRNNTMRHKNSRNVLYDKCVRAWRTDKANELLRDCSNDSASYKAENNIKSATKLMK